MSKQKLFSLKQSTFQIIFAGFIDNHKPVSLQLYTSNQHHYTIGMDPRQTPVFTFFGPRDIDFERPGHVVAAGRALFPAGKDPHLRRAADREIAGKAHGTVHE